jgi:squalene-associated FAD-dependent desaturase
MSAVHIIGAGLAGLAAAVRLASRDVRVVLHEAAPQAGGRCRSYFDSQLGMSIDNGNHLVLSGNSAMLDYADAIGSRGALSDPGRAHFPFVDLQSGQRWTLQLDEGRVPLWIFNKQRRVPGTRALDYLSLAPLLRASSSQTMGEAMRCPQRLYDWLIKPLFVAVLNTEPAEGSARLAGNVLRETLVPGGRACHPLFAADGLDAAFVTPALRYLALRGARVMMPHRLRALAFEGDTVSGLDFGNGVEPLHAGDSVLLAVPSWVATGLIPELSAPDEYRAIVNAHFAVDPPAGCPPIQGVVGAKTEWLFAFHGRLSVTISNADRFLDIEREALARDIWHEVAAATGLPADPMPRWQLVREKRATFAATPAQDALRPPAATRWRNLALAGDWIDNGLPATIEGAIRSGNRAADLLHK